MSITNETNVNGHKQNSSDESDEEQENEQTAAAAAASAVPSDDTNKEIDPNEPDPINKRMGFLEF